MTIRSGRLGVVNGHGSIQNWQTQQVQTPARFAASNTGGGMASREGSHDWSGSFLQMLALPTIMPGEKFTFLGYTNDEDGSGSASYTGDAIVDSVAITWNWQTGATIQTAVTFSGDGEYTDGVATGTDATVLDTDEACGTKIEVDGVEWTDLVSATLTITSANVAYTNSSTVENGKCWANRRPGVIDWSLAVQEENSDGLPAGRAVGADGEIKLYSDATLFWHLIEGHFVDDTGLNIDRNSGAIIGRTRNLVMNGAHQGAAQLGAIIKPGGSLWWGTAPA